MSNKPLSVTIVIPTCYGGDSLITTAESLLASTNIGKFRFMIVSDRNPIKPETKKALEAMGIEIYWNEIVGSQPKKLKQAREMINSDLFIFTQDDIYFYKETLSGLVCAFEEDPALTMAAAGILPKPNPETWVEAGMASNIRMVYHIAKRWNNGDNYLAASGRCMAFRMSTFRKYQIPEKLVNADMYLYLENRRLGGTFRMVPDARVLIRPPQSLKDQIGPSSRFQYQREELSEIFSENLIKYYEIPLYVLLKVVIGELVRSPIGMISYLCVYLFSRICRQSVKVASNPNWNVDQSTKKM